MTMRRGIAASCGRAWIVAVLTFHGVALGPLRGDDLDPHVRRLRDPNAQARWEAARALGAVECDATPALSALAVALYDDDALVRREVVRALGRIGEPAVAWLVVALRDPDPDVRCQAIQVLGGLERRAALAAPALVRAFDDEDDLVREHALAAFGAIAAIEDRATLAVVRFLELGNVPVSQAHVDALERSADAWIARQLAAVQARASPARSDASRALVRACARPALRLLERHAALDDPCQGEVVAMFIALVEKLGEIAHHRATADTAPVRVVDAVADRLDLAHHVLSRLAYRDAWRAEAARGVRHLDRCIVEGLRAGVRAISADEWGSLDDDVLPLLVHAARAAEGSPFLVRGRYGLRVMAGWSDAARAAFAALPPLSRAAERDLLELMAPRVGRDVEPPVRADPGAFPVVADRLRDPWTRVLAVRALGTVGDDDVAAALRVAIDDPDALVRATAARAIAALDPPWWGLTYELLEHEDPEVRRGVYAVLLDRLGRADRAHVATLCWIIARRHSPARVLAIHLLAHIADASAIPALRAAVPVGEPDPMVWAEALWARGVLLHRPVASVDSHAR